MGAPIVGIFVGGKGRRMGGVTKGLLPTAGGESVVARLVRIVRSSLGEARLVLVGEASAYSELGLPSLADDPAGVGPLGGLCALLREGAESRAPWVLALACDMPFVDERLLEKLASFSPESPAVAPRTDGTWEPLCARYEPGRVLVTARGELTAGRRSLQAIFDALAADAVGLPLAAADQRLLHDWDEPSDVE